MSIAEVDKGVIVRDENGRFAKGTQAPATIRTSEHARSLSEKRWEKARKATASRIMREAMAIDPDVQNEYDAHALMMAKQYTTIIKSDKPRMDDAEKLAQAMGTMPHSAELRQVGTQPAAQVHDADELIMLILRRRLAVADVVDGDVIGSE